MMLTKLAKVLCILMSAVFISPALAIDNEDLYRFPFCPYSDMSRKIQYHPEKPNISFAEGSSSWQCGLGAASGANWLALACTEVVCRLTPAKLTVTTENWQGHYDDKPYEGQRHSYEALELNADEKVVAWFQIDSSVPWIKAGSVETYRTAAKHKKEDNNKLTAEVFVPVPTGGIEKLVPVLVSPRLTPKADQLLDNWQGTTRMFIQLRASGQRQLFPDILASCYGELKDDYFLWAGDLDKDNKTDYLVSFVDGGGPVNLYLSSYAKNNELVGQAGEFLSTPFGGECDGYRLWGMYE